MSRVGESVSNLKEPAPVFLEDKIPEVEAKPRPVPNNNGISMNLTWSTMNQLRYIARLEGITAEELALELVNEGVNRRLDESTRGAPSHLMTRTGYLHPNEAAGYQQPQLSHHQQNQNGNYPKSKPNFQQGKARNPQRSHNQSSATRKDEDGFQQHNKKPR